MKKILALTFLIGLFNLSTAQNESISLKNNINWISKGKIYSISKDEILYKPSSSENDNIIFKDQNGMRTLYKSNRQNNGLFKGREMKLILKKPQINLKNTY